MNELQKRDTPLDRQIDCTTCVMPSTPRRSAREEQLRWRPRVFRSFVNLLAAKSPEFLPDPPDMAHRVDTGHDLPQERVQHEVQSGSRVSREPLEGQRILPVKGFAQLFQHGIDFLRVQLQLLAP